MASSTPKLETLPAEIIKRIASFSPTSSVLALFHVSRRLHSVCNDYAVFKSIISYNNAQPGQKLWDITPSSPSDYVRYALADLKAREWRAFPHALIPYSDDESTVIEKDDYFKRFEKSKYQKAIAWAPKLASLYHPFITGIDILESIKLFSEEDPSANLGLNFIILCAVLYQSQPPPDGNGVPLAVFDHLKAVKREMASVDLRALIKTPIPDPTILALSLLLYTRQYPYVVRIPLPSPFKIPFPELMDLPSPFPRAEKSGDLNTSHLKAMTSKSFLENGEWVGYYSYGTNILLHNSTTFDPPMHGIRFNVDDQMGDGSLMSLNAKGKDKVGSFELGGNVASTGEVSMRKAYEGFWWQWRGRMTPVGIMGMWGRDEAWNRDRGYFWLWKREWSN